MWKMFMWVYWKIRLLRRRGVLKNQYLGENCLKRRIWTVFRFKEGGLAKKRGCCFGGRLIPQCALCIYFKNVIGKRLVRDIGLIISTKHYNTIEFFVCVVIYSTITVSKVHTRRTSDRGIYLTVLILDVLPGHSNIIGEKCFNLFDDILPNAYICPLCIPLRENLVL